MEDEIGRSPGTGLRTSRPARALLACVAVLACALASLPSMASAAGTGAEAPGPFGLAALGAGPLAGGRAVVTSKAQITGVASRPSSTEPYWACPEEQCEAIIDPAPRRGRSGRFELPGGPQLEGSGELGGFDPQDLRSAYDIPSGGGSEETIALVDAYGYPNAEANLAVYRERYGLPPCSKANGCFAKVNQSGVEGEYPAAVESWETESALDLEMASTACPECHIMLVEGKTNGDINLAEAVNTAARLGASEISASYGKAASSCQDGCASERGAYDHPGILIAAAAGDKGYGPNFPASLPSVVAVGGTALHHAPNARGWSEEVWYEASRGSGTGGGCSEFEKPVWQLDSVCTGRTANDVSADAACVTPVSVYNIHGWVNVCGTSASTPLVAGIEAHASAYARAEGGDAFYEDPAAAHDVTEGSDGECGTAEYLCHAEPGYDGPTGVGTPDGPLQLSAGGPPLVLTRSAGAVSGSAATLEGSVNPQGEESTYQFEYGTTTSYGTSVPLPAGTLAAGTVEEPVAQALGGLQANTTYHYRVLATSAAGTSYGQDSSFRTAAPTVSAVEPAGGPIDGGHTVTVAGTNFAGVTGVRFGTTAASSFTVTSEDAISATPPLGHGDVEVTVTTPAGTSAATPASEFSYQPEASLLAWGAGGGQLGDGLAAESRLPVEVRGGLQASALAAGSEHALALGPGGAVTAWGNNRFGQLGDGSTATSDLPLPVCAAGAGGECSGGPYLQEASAISAGRQQSLALLANGTVLAWGGNEYGQLGADVAQSSVPVPVCMKAEFPCQPENELREVAAIAAGGSASFALLDNGTVLAWGANEEGQLGDGSTGGAETCTGLACSRTPVPVSGLSDVTAIAAGASNGLALLGDGHVMAWGYNAFGQLGDGTRTDSDVPATVCAAGEQSPCSGALGGVSAISAGADFGFALLGNGSLLAGAMTASASSGLRRANRPNNAVSCRSR